MDKGFGLIVMELLETPQVVVGITQVQGIVITKTLLLVGQRCFLCRYSFGSNGFFQRLELRCEARNRGSLEDELRLELALIQFLELGKNFNGE